MRKEDIRRGIILRVISSHGLGTPKHAIATVETVETNPSGDWGCTIHYDNRRSKRGQWLYRSHLWEYDLSRFEIVTDMNTILLSASRQAKCPFQPIAPRDQLDLPFQSDEG